MANNSCDKTNKCLFMCVLLSLYRHIHTCTCACMQTNTNRLLKPIRKRKVYKRWWQTRFLLMGKYDKQRAKCLMRESREEFAFTRIFAMRYETHTYVCMLVYRYVLQCCCWCICIETCKLSYYTRTYTRRY